MNSANHEKGEISVHRRIITFYLKFISKLEQFFKIGINFAQSFLSKNCVTMSHFYAILCVVFILFLPKRTDSWVLPSLYSYDSIVEANIDDKFIHSTIDLW